MWENEFGTLRPGDKVYIVDDINESMRYVTHHMVEHFRGTTGTVIEIPDMSTDSVLLGMPDGNTWYWPSEALEKPPVKFVPASEDNLAEFLGV